MPEYIVPVSPTRDAVKTGRDTYCLVDSESGEVLVPRLTPSEVSDLRRENALEGAD